VRQDAEGYQRRDVGRAGKRAFFRQKREGLNEFIEGEADPSNTTARPTSCASSARRDAPPGGHHAAGPGHGDVIVYNNRTEVYTVEARPRAGRGRSGRVRAVLAPRAPASQAPAATCRCAPAPRVPAAGARPEAKHGPSRLEVRGLRKNYGAPRGQDVSLDVPAARWWACWAPTARARPPRST
jgi:lipopolysaccharide export system protein LptA